MEKLEPILKQKFWILLGVAILMTFIGWWMATSEMAAAITKRTGEIDKSFGDVPKGETPSKNWAEKLGAVNVNQDKSIKTTQLGMWKRQLAKMTFPEGVEPVNGYWQKFPNETRQLYRDSYENQIIQLWKMLNPLIEETGTGVVRYPRQAVSLVIGKGPWPESPPQSDVIWEAQEDIWLLEALFQTITALNGGLEAGRAEAVIHEIDRLELRGGGEKSKSGGGGGGGAIGGSENTMGGPGTMGVMGAPALGGMGGTGSGGRQPTMMAGGLGGGLTVVPVEFDPTEEFGDDGSGSSGGSGPAMGRSMSSAGMGELGSMTPGDSSATAKTEKTINRYVIPKDPSKPRETGPFRTRGFYLSVKMDHMKIPQLIEELSSNDKSVWPIEIVRVQMAHINEDGDSGVGGSMGGGAGGRPSMRTQMPMPMAGGASSLMSGPSGSNDLFSGFGSRSSTAVESNSPEALAARAALDNALKDPMMAQVTLCGYFTLYNKVDEPTEPAAPPAAAPRTEEPPAAEANTTDEEGKSSAPTDNPTTAAAASGPADTMDDAPADGDDSPAPKGEGTIEPKAEPKAEPKPE